MTNRPIILHIVRNQVTGDSRVLRALTAVSDAFPDYEAKCVGYSDERPSNFIIGDVKVSIINAGTWSSLPKIIARFMKYLNWHRQCVNRFGEESVSVVHCHELVPLMISVHLKLKTGCKIIYDAHELETECRTNNFDKIMKPIYKTVEWLGIKCASCVITVSDSICRWYKSRNPKTDVKVVLNCPEVNLCSNVSTTIDKSKPMSFVYCGAFVSGRGIDLYLDVFKKNNGKLLYFLGDGPLLGDIKKCALEYENIIYLGKVKPDAVVNALQIADVSLCLIDDITLTSKFCMPNKLFESVVAGLPVVVSDLPDLREFVTRNDAGWILGYNAIELNKLINKLSKEDLEKKKKKMVGLDELYSWKSEKVKLTTIYENLLKRKNSI